MNPHYNHEHLMHRIGWLRAAMLGANDGIISVASLLFGLLASNFHSVLTSVTLTSEAVAQIASVFSAATLHTSALNLGVELGFSLEGGRLVSYVLLPGIAALIAGASSMAAGEWVSVMSQLDAERAELDLERQHILANPDAELLELQSIYQQRGLSPALAQEVAKALTAYDAVGSHARDELGISPNYSAQPMQAALASALSFLAGGICPLVLLMVLAFQGLPLLIVLLALGFGTLLLLFVSGELVARLSNTKPWRPGFRVVFWGAISMTLSTAIGWLLGGVF